MDDAYQINAAKTEFREAYNNGDAARLVAVFHDHAVNMSDALPSRSGVAGKKGLAERAAEVFAGYSVQLVPIIIEIIPCGDKMFDRGWHEFTLTPKEGGAPVRIRQRYMELWAKNTAGEWKILYYMTNADIRMELKGTLATWFANQLPVAATA